MKKLLSLIFVLLALSSVGQNQYYGVFNGVNSPLTNSTLYGSTTIPLATTNVLYAGKFGSTTGNGTGTSLGSFNVPVFYLAGDTTVQGAASSSVDFTQVIAAGNPYSSGPAVSLLSADLNSNYWNNGFVPGVIGTNSTGERWGWSTIFPSFVSTPIQGPVGDAPGYGFIVANGTPVGIAMSVLVGNPNSPAAIIATNTWTLATGEVYSNITTYYQTNGTQQAILSSNLVNGVMVSNLTINTANNNSSVNQNAFGFVMTPVSGGSGTISQIPLNQPGITLIGSPGQTNLVTFDQRGAGSVTIPLGALTVGAVNGGGQTAVFGNGITTYSVGGKVTFNDGGGAYFRSGGLDVFQIGTTANGLFLQDTAGSKQIGQFTSSGGWTLGQNSMSINPQTTGTGAVGTANGAFGYINGVTNNANYATVSNMLTAKYVGYSGSSPTFSTNGGFGAYADTVFIISGTDQRFKFKLPVGATAIPASTKIGAITFSATAPSAPYMVAFYAADPSGAGAAAVNGANGSLFIRIYGSNYTTSGFDVWVNASGWTANTTNVMFGKVEW